MADKPQATPEAPPPPSDQLNPMEMPGKGQSLPPAERRQAEHLAAVAEAKRKGDEETRKAEAALLIANREAAASEQDERRTAAIKEADAQREAFAEQRSRLQPLAADPATLALEAAINASMAAALEQDETVPGGVYLVGGKHVDADGRPLE